MKVGIPLVGFAPITLMYGCLWGGDYMLNNKLRNLGLYRKYGIAECENWGINM